jgi:hypothetical protein
VIGFDCFDIFSGAVPRFLPIIEHIREAAKFQLQLEDYIATTQSMIPVLIMGENEEWDLSMQVGEKSVSCLFRAVNKDPNFGMNTMIHDVFPSAFTTMMGDTTTTTNSTTNHYHSVQCI